MDSLVDKYFGNKGVLLKNKPHPLQPIFSKKALFQKYPTLRSDETTNVIFYRDTVTYEPLYEGYGCAGPGGNLFRRGRGQT
ncbi:hypothetical protein GCM10027275_33820 [Rhabdobacter roseus]